MPCLIARPTQAHRVDKVIQNSLIPVYDYLKGGKRGELIGLNVWEGERKNQWGETYFRFPIHLFCSFVSAFFLLQSVLYPPTKLD